MQGSKAKIRAIPFEDPTEAVDTVVGEIVAIDESGRASVTFPGRRGRPVPARSVVDAPAPPGQGPEDLVGRQVLLTFDAGDESRPIIVGFVRDSLFPESTREEVRLDLGADRDVRIDGRRIAFEAQEEVVLRCGKSTIWMRRDGKVVVRGSDVLTRSSGSNRVKGASIQLN